MAYLSKRGSSFVVFYYQQSFGLPLLNNFIGYEVYADFVSWSYTERRNYACLNILRMALIYY